MGEGRLKNRSVIRIHEATFRPNVIRLYLHPAANMHVDVELLGLVDQCIASPGGGLEKLWLKNRPGLVLGNITLVDLKLQYCFGARVRLDNIMHEGDLAGARRIESGQARGPERFLPQTRRPDFLEPKPEYLLPPRRGKGQCAKFTPNLWAK